MLEADIAALETDPAYIDMRNWKQAVFDEAVQLATVNKLNGMTLETTTNTDRFNTIIDWKKRINNLDEYPSNQTWFFVQQKMQKYRQRLRKMKTRLGMDLGELDPSNNLTFTKGFRGQLVEKRLELLGNKYPILRQIVDDEVDLTFYFMKVNYDDAVEICKRQNMDVFFPRSYGETKIVAEMRDHVYGDTNDWAMAGLREYKLPFWLGAKRGPSHKSNFLIPTGKVRNFYNDLPEDHPGYIGVQWAKGAGKYQPIKGRKNRCLELMVEYDTESSSYNDKFAKAINRPCQSFGSGYRAANNGVASDYEKLPFACERRIFNRPNYIDFTVENVKILPSQERTFQADITMLKKPKAEITTILRAAEWDSGSPYSAMPMFQYNSTSGYLFVTGFECDATDYSNVQYNTEVTDDSMDQPILHVGHTFTLTIKIMPTYRWDSTLNVRDTSTVLTNLAFQLIYPNASHLNFFGHIKPYNICHDLERNVDFKFLPENDLDPATSVKPGDFKIENLALNEWYQLYQNSVRVPNLELGKSYIMSFEVVYGNETTSGHTDWRKSGEYDYYPLFWVMKTDNQNQNQAMPLVLLGHNTIMIEGSDCEGNQRITAEGELPDNLVPVTDKVYKVEIRKELHQMKFTWTDIESGNFVEIEAADGWEQVCSDENAIAKINFGNDKWALPWVDWKTGFFSQVYPKADPEQMAIKKFKYFSF